MGGGAFGPRLATLVAVTATPDPDSAPEQPGDIAESDDAASTAGTAKRSALREGALLVGIAVVLYYVMLTFIARPYLIPSESMEPTLHGCPGCVGDRIMVDKISYRFGSPRPGDVKRAVIRRVRSPGRE